MASKPKFATVIPSSEEFDQMRRDKKAKDKLSRSKGKSKGADSKSSGFYFEHQRDKEDAVIELARELLEITTYGHALTVGNKMIEEHGKLHGLDRKLATSRFNTQHRTDVMSYSEKSIRVGLSRAWEALDAGFKIVFKDVDRVTVESSLHAKYGRRATPSGTSNERQLTTA